MKYTEQEYKVASRAYYVGQMDRDYPDAFPDEQRDGQVPEDLIEMNHAAYLLAFFAKTSLKRIDPCSFQQVVLESEKKFGEKFRSMGLFIRKYDPFS